VNGFKATVLGRCGSGQNANICIWLDQVPVQINTLKGIFDRKGAETEEPEKEEK
jgi:hypothetical protein